MKATELRIKFENLYETISSDLHKVCENDGFNEALYDETQKKVASFKRLFWSICKGQLDNEDFINNLRWELRHADYVDFFYEYKRYFGLVPSWQR